MREYTDRIRIAVTPEQRELIKRMVKYQVEDYYDYLLDASEAELKENIGEIERRLSESVREFDEIRGRSERRA